MFRIIYENRNSTLTGGRVIWAKGSMVLSTRILFRVFCTDEGRSVYDAACTLSKAAYNRYAGKRCEYDRTHVCL